MSNVDIFSIATNGIIPTDPRSKIVDLLGYYTIIFEEEIVDPPIDIPKPETSVAFGGGIPYYVGKLGYKSKLKRIRLKVEFDDYPNKEFVQEIYFDDFNIKIDNVSITEDNVNVKVINETILEYNKEISFKIKNLL